MKKSLVTDQKGKIHINDLKPGDYQFVETKAPHGYKLDDQPILFTIEKKSAEATSSNCEESLDFRKSAYHKGETSRQIEL
ncbi:prealbumin-like fold domain-containing protein [Bacillus sp. SL00103]